MAFFKHYDQQFESSIARDPVLRSVFNDMCSLADRNGIVDKSYQTVAKITGWPIETVITKISDLMKPDPDSRSKKCDGARLVLIQPTRPWGWRIVNYIEYRNRRDSEARRTQNKEAQQRWRDNQKDRKPNVSQDCLRKQTSASVSERNHASASVSERKHASATPVPDARGGVSHSKPASANVSHSKPESAHADAYIRVPPLPPTGGNGSLNSFLPVPQDPNPLSALLLAKEKRKRRRDYVAEEEEQDEELSGWTDELLAAAKAEFPAANLPEKFDALPVDIRRRITERLKKMAA